MDYLIAYGISALISVVGIAWIVIFGLRKMILTQKSNSLLLLSTTILLLIKIQLLFSSWILRPSNNAINIWEASLLFLISLLWTLIATILFPLTDDGFFDLDTHYFNVKTVAFTLAMLNIVLNGFFDVMFIGEPLFSVKNFWRAFMFCAALFLAAEKIDATQKKAWHIFVLLTMIGLPFIHFMVNFTN